MISHLVADWTTIEHISGGAGASSGVGFWLYRAIRAEIRANREMTRNVLSQLTLHIADDEQKFFRPCTTY